FGESVESATIAGGAYLPLLPVADGMSAGRTATGDDLVEDDLPDQAAPSSSSSDRRQGRVFTVVGLGYPGDLLVVEDGGPATLFEGSGVVSCSGLWFGDGDQFTVVGRGYLYTQALDAMLSGVVRLL